MKKEYVVVRIDSAPDGAPYVIVTLSPSKEMKEKGDPSKQFGQNMMGFSNMEDMMKNLNKVLSGAMMPNMTSIKLEMHEYKDLNLSVGDKVFLEISKEEKFGV
ncbi:MAG: hypothetical protein GWN01_08180 [Nitrosopumilaceae archaeon]|nr:hypothetical protein [Nitrosopumilaceae archaeon]NIU00896.1 hypothetical protein [Nitrosopumilaceae archaeon]NIU87349.1 hypothetical protein [Nitrosopumilaceae archaeon]NIV65877.1 hypothetical protein [Nitrosopumilaceae archaeon]NIX61498.1 hypothetical protein [Nitrosopumilaceae archaeon]